MKKVFVFTLLIFAFSFDSFAQSVTITAKKVTYTRPKPFTESKKSFSVTYPRVRAATAALSRKIENTISFARVLNLNLREERDEVQWLEEAGYDIGYNRRGILSIRLWMIGSAAYPSEFAKTVVVNLKTGNQAKPADVFTNLEALAAENKKRQQAEMKKSKEEYKKLEDAEDYDGSPYFDQADFGVKNLEGFSISEEGVTFYYDYGFPRVILALQPEGNYFFTWQELKPFIKRGGLLEQFTR